MKKRTHTHTQYNFKLILLLFNLTCSESNVQVKVSLYLYKAMVQYQQPVPHLQCSVHDRSQEETQQRKPVLYSRANFSNMCPRGYLRYV